MSDGIEFTAGAGGVTWQPTPQIPIIAIRSERDKSTLYTSMQQIHNEGNFDKKSHTFLLLNEIMYHGGRVFVFEFTTYEFLVECTKRYLWDYRPNAWQRMFPVNWSPKIMHQYIGWLEKSNCVIQLDISYRESIDAANRDAFYPPNPKPYIPEFIQAKPSAYKGYDANEGYSVNSTYGEAFNGEPPFRKKWEK